MPLIARKDNDPVKSVWVKLPLSIIDRLDRYAEYVQGDRSYVVTEALKLVFSQDKEFGKVHDLAEARRNRPGKPEVPSSQTDTQ